MGWASKCDRCGKYFDYEEGATAGVALMVYDRPTDDYEIANGMADDLCPDCVEDYIAWWHQGKQKTGGV